MILETWNLDFRRAYCLDSAVPVCFGKPGWREI